MVECISSVSVLPSAPVRESTVWDCPFRGCMFNYKALNSRSNISLTPAPDTEWSTDGVKMFI